jgi:hypothetical protein
MLIDLALLLFVAADGNWMTLRQSRYAKFVYIFINTYWQKQKSTSSKLFFFDVRVDIDLKRLDLNSSVAFKEPTFDVVERHFNEKRQSDGHGSDAQIFVDIKLKERKELSQG